MTKRNPNRITKAMIDRKINHTFSEAAEAYRAMLHSEGRLTRDTELRIVRLEKRWGREKLADITPQAWSAYLYNTWKGLSPSTMARNLAVMRAIIRHAESLGWLYDAPKLKTPRYKDSRNTHLEKDEIMKVIEFARAHYGPLPAFVLLLLCDTGLRFGEALNLRWKDIDAEWVRVRRRRGKGTYHTKTVERNIPTSPRLLEFMARYKILPTSIDDADKSIIQDRWNERPWTIGKRLNQILRDSVIMTNAKAGIEIRVHDLRHTFAFLCASAGADLGDIMELMGHNSISMTMRYRGFVKSRAVAAVMKMGEVNKTP